MLVAGDVYDRAVPPTDAVALLDEALAGFAAAAVDVVLTSGNHDSAIRLGFGRTLAAHAGVHLRTDLERARATRSCSTTSRSTASRTCCPTR